MGYIIIEVGDVKVINKFEEDVEYTATHTDPPRIVATPGNVFRELDPTGEGMADISPGPEDGGLANVNVFLSGTAGNNPWEESFRYGCSGLMSGTIFYKSMSSNIW